MEIQSSLPVLLVFGLSNILSTFANDLARGFNDDIQWYGMSDGLSIAKEQNKPVMLLIHKTWCGACKALKPRFATDKAIEKLSEKFVMINVQDDEEPSDKQFSPDGAYIPRIFFMTPEGNVFRDLYNDGGNKQYKYFYSSPEQIVTSMTRALDRHRKEEL